MSVLIADKSLPFAVSLAAALHGKNISAALVSGDPSDTEAVREIRWNRSSSLSAKTVLIEAKSAFASLDQAVLLFDTPFLLATVPAGNSFANIVDEHIKGYLLLVREINAFFAQQKKGRLVFVVRGRDALQSPAAVPSNIPVAVCEAAFTALAAETASACSLQPNPALQTLLVTLESGEEAENLAWLVEQLEQTTPSRNQTRWIKAGQRGLFGKL